MTIRILPVIHLRDNAQAASEARLAQDAGCDGVFLIDMTGGQVSAMRRALDSVHEFLAPGAFLVGVNLLGDSMIRAVKRAQGWTAAGTRVDAVWSDECAVDGGRSWKQQPAALTGLPAACDGWPGEVFGGVAFKTGPWVPTGHVGDQAFIGGMWLDAVTTSGAGTGVPAELDRLREAARGVETARQTIDLLDHPGRRPRLAVASGVTPDNVRAQLEAGVQDVLVATGIGRNFHQMDAALLAQLVLNVRAHDDREQNGCSCTPDPDTGELHADDGWRCQHD